MRLAPLLVPAPQQPAAAVQRHVNLVVVHCSATPSGRWLRGRRGEAGFVEAVAVIDGWHGQAPHNFKRTAQAVARFNPQLQHVGYHYVIDIDGTIETGRSILEVGAHVRDFNSASVGVCMVGGLERDARYTAAQWTALAAVVRTLCTNLGVPALLPLYPRQGGGVCGHRDLSPDTNADGKVSPYEWLKTCPGFDVGAWLGRGMLPLPQQVCEEYVP